MKKILSSSSPFIKFIRNSSLFFLGTFSSKILTFLLLPVYSYLIPPADMGVYDVSITLMTMVASICFFEIWSGVLRKSYEVNSSNDKMKIIAGGLQVFFISSIIFTICCISICYAIGYKYIYYIALYMILYMFSNYFTFAVRALNKNKQFAFSGFLCSVITLISNIVLLVALNFDYSALYISASLGFVIQIIYLFIRCKLYKIIPSLFVWNKDNYSLIKFCLPLCLNTVAFWCLTSLNRVIFNQIFGDSLSGVFAMGARFSTLVTLITTCFNYAWQDLSFAEGTKQGTTSSLYSKGCNLYLYFLLAGFLIIVPLLYFIAPFFIRGDYTGAIASLPLFILSATISGFSSFLGSTFYAINDTKGLLITTIIGSIFNIIISYPVIFLLGINGANIATSLSFLVIIITRIVILKKKISFSVNFKIITYYLLMIIITCLSFTYMDWRMNIIILIGGLVCSALFLVTFISRRKER